MSFIVRPTAEIHIANPPIADDEEMIAMCNQLGLGIPYQHLVDLPSDEQGNRKPIKAASVILLEKVNNEYCILLEERNWPENTYSPPGGNRATEEKTQWDTRDPPSQEQIIIEKMNPIVTAARETGEEIGALFDPCLAKEIFDLSKTLKQKTKKFSLHAEEIKEIKKSLERKELEMTRIIYTILNQGDTQVFTDSGVHSHPVFIYVRPCTEEMTKRIDNQESITSDEVVGITRVALTAFEEAFENPPEFQNKKNREHYKWTKKGFYTRMQRIANTPKGDQTDLRDMPQYDINLTVKNLAGDSILLTNYTAQSIFLHFEDIKKMAKNWYEKPETLISVLATT